MMSYGGISSARYATVMCYLFIIIIVCTYIYRVQLLTLLNDNKQIILILIISHALYFPQITCVQIL